MKYRLEYNKNPEEIRCVGGFLFEKMNWTSHCNDYDADLFSLSEARYILTHTHLRKYYTLRIVSHTDCFL